MEELTIKRLNDECMEKRLGKDKWTLKDLEEDRNYCWNMYTSYDMCPNCDLNIRIYKSSKVDCLRLKKRIDRLEEFIKKLYPDFPDEEFPNFLTNDAYTWLEYL